MEEIADLRVLVTRLRGTVGDPSTLVMRGVVRRPGMGRRRYRARAFVQHTRVKRMSHRQARRVIGGAPLGD